MWNIFMFLDVPVDSSNAPEDAKEIAKKLIASGVGFYVFIFFLT